MASRPAMYVQVSLAPFRIMSGPSYLEIIGSAVPSEWSGEELALHVDSVMSAEALLVAVEDQVVLAWSFNPDAVIHKGLRPVD